MARLPNNPLVSELFRAVHGAKTKDKKIELLKAHKRDDVKSILIYLLACLPNLQDHP